MFVRTPSEDEHAFFIVTFVFSHFCRCTIQCNICLTTTDTSRLRGDQIEVFKILNGYENINRNTFSHFRKSIVELEDMR